MSDHDSFTGLPALVDEDQTRRWAATLVKAVLTVLVVGVILSVILWPAVSADVGALTLCVMFATCAGLLVIRQALLAERS